MSAAVCDFYDLIREESGKPLQHFSAFFSETKNRTAEIEVELERGALGGSYQNAVYTLSHIHGRITIMSAFRKDLFMSVTLPLLGSAVGALALVWAAYTHIDSKLDAVRSDASSSLDHLGDTLRVELRADRDARAKEFEAIRIEMREDRKDTRDALKELMNRS